MEHGVVLVLMVSWLACSGCLGMVAEQEWQGWKERHYKVYSSPDEEGSRLSIWKDNYNKIVQHNMANHSFTLSLNQFADMVSSMTAIASRIIAAACMKS